jgi:4-aminobutyrate aminotransferase-like enzyme
MDPTAITRSVESTAVNTFRLTSDPPLFVSGDGPWLTDADGRRWLDLVCGSATTALGHGHPAHRAAIAEALETGILHTGTRLPNPFRARLYEELRQVLPAHLDAVHLANSGAEAVETALKAAMRMTGRRHFIAFEGGYHGRTLGALALTHAERLRAPFEPWDRPWATFCPYAGTDIEAPAALDSLEKALAAPGRPAAGVVIEAVQGVSGVIGPSPVFLRGVEALCRAHGALLIVDEIWSGLGRSGRMFAFDHAGLAPDLVALGKGLSASLPLSAVAGRSDILRTWAPGSHTSTFMGNPLACAAAAATLRTLREERLADRAAHDIAPAMRAALAPLRGHAREVRVVGAQAAVDLGDAARATEVQRRALTEAQLLVYGGGRDGECVMALPPLTIAIDVLLDGLERLARIARAV